MRKSNQAEFSSWLNERQSMLIHAARGICFDVQFAEDVLQEALMDVYKHWDKIRDHEHLEAYAIRVMVSKHIDMRRKWIRKRMETEVELSHADSMMNLDDTSDEIAQHLLVQGALKALSPAQRAVLLLHYEYGYSLREVAKVLEIPPGTVASHLARGKAAIAANVEYLPAIIQLDKKAISHRSNKEIEIEEAEVIEE